MPYDHQFYDYDVNGRFFNFLVKDYEVEDGIWVENFADVIETFDPTLPFKAGGPPEDVEIAHELGNELPLGYSFNDQTGFIEKSIAPEDFVKILSDAKAVKKLDDKMYELVKAQANDDFEPVF